ncbi:response regulator transcription factor [Paenisporosarcina indica]|uniref:response regulator transcription factor n=1 Tax=Paenisporosarcina indica TaxID=650093 RepID=UPI0009502E01|nr:response regulator transcription factor [Paenisporosarcina indica]
MKVVVIDDDKAMHLIMKRMLAKVNEIEIVAIFQETITAFSFLTKSTADLLFLDINMARESGMDFAKRLREYGCDIKIVFITSHKEYALPAYEVFAYDYIVKPITEKRLHLTINRALSEKAAQGKKETNIETVPQPFFIEPLTKREKEILTLISSGMTNKEIALLLKLTEGTIKNYGVHIFSKLQVKNRVQAIATATKYNLLD